MTVLGENKAATLMGSSRKKKEKKKDFVKPKLKVGKTAAKANNHTSTDFKAKRINISSSTRNLVSGHANSLSSEYLKKFSVVRKTTSNLNSRKEILAEILETLKKDPYQETHQVPLDDLIKILRTLFLDQSKKIRTDAREILIELIKHHNNLIILNHDSLMLFIFSAMTHLKPTIRQDSIYTLGAILDGGERLRKLTVANYWIRVWKNILILMNWKMENKSYVDSNDFKDYDGMRLEQLNFINKFLEAGCFEETDSANPGEAELAAIQQHSLLPAYMLKPNMGMLYRNLKLFGNISIVSSNGSASNATTAIISSANQHEDDDESNDLDDTMLCEDVNDRIKVFVDGFYKSVKNGLTDFTKVEDQKLVLLSEKLLKVLDAIKNKYDEILD